MSEHEPWSEERTRAIVSHHSHLEGPLMPILHAVQDAFGFVPEEAVPVIAQELNLSRAEVHGVVTFYHDFAANRRAARCSKCVAPRPARRWVARAWSNVPKTASS